MIQPRSPLDELQLRRFQARLLEDRRRLRDDLGRLYGESIRTPERTPLADLGSEADEQSQDLGLAEQAGRRIIETDRAIERIEQGTYGICESCGRSISIERLDAIPSAERCAACQSTLERGGGTSS